MEFTKYCQELVRLLQTSLLNLTESKIRRLRHSLLVIMKLPPICISFVPISLKGLLKIMLLFSACHVEIPHGSGHTGYGSLDQHPANWQVHTVPVLMVFFCLFFCIHGLTLSGCEKSCVCYHLSSFIKQVWLRNPWIRFGHTVQHHLQRWRRGARYWLSVTMEEEMNCNWNQFDWF